MKQKIYFVIAILLITITSSHCKNDLLSEVTSSKKIEKIIKLESVIFAKNNSSGKIANYDEGACTIKVDTIWQAGTRCFTSVGNTCTTPTACVPIGKAISSGQFTKVEIDKKIALIEKTFGVKYTY
ncbi:MAG: hypothetical protein WCH29_09345 [Chitinophagaceae bacterium]